MPSAAGTFLQRVATVVNRATGGRLRESALLRQVYYRTLAATAHYDRDNREFDTQRVEFADYALLLDREKYHHEQIASGDIDHEIAALRDVVSPGDLLFDVGANIGAFTVPAAVDGADVVACEPESLVRELLDANVRHNDLADRVTVCDRAISDAEGEATLYISGQENQGTHALTRTAHHGGRTTVETTTADALAATHGHPDVVKIDVEGAEERVLDGMSQILSRDATLLVDVHEYELEAMGGSPDAVIDRLFALGDGQVVAADGRRDVTAADAVEAPATLLVDV